MLLSGFFCLKKTYKKKVDFFDKNHGLTPLQKANFFDFGRVSLLRSKSIFYYPEYQNIFLSCFVCSKKTYKKKVEFLPKTMYKPLCKMSVFLTLLELNFSGVKRILYFPEYKKLVLPGFFC